MRLVTVRRELWRAPARVAVMWPLLLGWKVMEVTKAVLVESVDSVESAVVVAAGQVQSMPWKRDAVEGVRGVRGA